jgi:hypothetical protein
MVTANRSALTELEGTGYDQLHLSEIASVSLDHHKGNVPTE